MPFVRLLGVLTGKRFTAALEHAEFDLDLTGATPVVRLVSYTTRNTVTLALTAGAMAAEGATSTQGSNRAALTVDGLSGTVAAAAVEAMRHAGGHSVSAFLHGLDFLADRAVELLQVTSGGTAYLVAARPDGQGLALFRLPATGDPVPLQTVSDSSATYLGGVSSLATATVAGTVLVFAGSGEEHGISVYRMTANGRLTGVAHAGMAEGVPVQAVSALRTVAYGGETWLIAAASGSSSLTVFRVAGDGGLTAVDHLSDTLDSRFQSVRVIEVAEAAGRVFLAVAGADDGISLFTLLPDGRLLHLETLADSEGASLSNVTALTMVVLGDRLQILAVSGAEAGLTVLEADLSGLGQVISASSGTVQGTAQADILHAAGAVGALSGGAGDDVLIDGPGTQNLTGGAGADIFVLSADGVADRILDFDPAQDRIDLSAWAMFRNAGQLSFTATATGGVIEFGNERLAITTASGRPLTEAQIRAMSFGTEVLRLSPSTWTYEPGEEEEEEEEPPPVPGFTRRDGTAGNDRLTGGTGADAYYGYAGNDTLVGGAGADSFYGGAGFDIVSFEALASSILLDLAAPASSSALLRDDVFEGVEGFHGTAHADRMTGTALADWFSGAGGNDTLYGQGGADSLYGGDGNDALYGGAGNDRIEGVAGQDSLWGGEGDDQLYGGAGDDTLAGGNGADLLYGGAGADRLSGDAGGDRLVAGAGADLVFGGAGADSLYGGDGGDTLRGGDGADLLYGEAGNDSLLGGNGGDRIEGHAGDDTLSGEGGADLLFGGGGRDRLSGGPGNDTLRGGAQNDTLFGGNGANMLYGEAGADSLVGGQGNDQISGGQGHDTIQAGAGNDRAAGNGGNDLILGEAGNDLLSGEAGHDTIRGGTGADTLDGGPGRDVLYGDEDTDLLRGGALADRLFGGAGNDTLYGGDGPDTIDGGPGKDWLYGGQGADVFVFETMHSGDIDRVLDFQDGIDRLRLGGVDGATPAARLAELTIESTVYDGAAGVMIRYDGQRIFLSGLEIDQIGVKDFLFV